MVMVVDNNNNDQEFTAHRPQQAQQPNQQQQQGAQIKFLFGKLIHKGQMVKRQPRDHQPHSAAHLSSLKKSCSFHNVDSSEASLTPRSSEEDDTTYDLNRASRTIESSSSQDVDFTFTSRRQNRLRLTKSMIIPDESRHVDESDPADLKSSSDSSIDNHQASNNVLSSSSVFVNGTMPPKKCKKMKPLRSRFKFKGNLIFSLKRKTKTKTAAHKKQKGTSTLSSLSFSFPGFLTNNKPVQKLSKVNKENETNNYTVVAFHQASGDSKLLTWYTREELLYYYQLLGKNQLVIYTYNCACVCSL